MQITSEELAGRVEATCKRIGVPAPVLCRIALDFYLNSMPQPPAAPPAPKPKRARAKKFVPPTHAQALEYFKQKGSPHPENDAPQFVDHHTSRGWKIGSTRIVDWKAAAQKWIRDAKSGRFDRKRGTRAPLPAPNPEEADWVG